MQKVIIPGILEKTLEEIKEKLEEVESMTPLVQIDVEDGTFTNATTFCDVDALNELDTSAILELHLMVQNPKNFIPKFPKAVRKLIFHIESQGLYREIIEDVEERGFEVCLCLNPDTPFEDVEPFLEFAGSVQFMTVNPGVQGQKFLPEVLEKIKAFTDEYPQIPVEVDGGINPHTASLSAQAGASLFVSGSYILDSEEIKKNIESLEEAIENED